MRVGMLERVVLVAVGVAAGHNRRAGVRVVAVVVAVFVLVHDRFVGVSMFVAGPEG